MTGVEILREFNRQVFKAYSNYYNTTKMNDLLKKALVVSIEDKYNSLLEQKDFDDLGGVIKLNKVFDLNNNQIYTAPLDIVNVVFGTDFTLTTSLPHNLEVGDSFTISNVAGFTPSINGVQVATSVADAFNIHFTATYTSGTYTAGTGQVTGVSLAGASKMAADYNHLLAVKAKFEQLLPYEVSDVTNTQPINIVLTTINNNIASSEKINVSGVLVNTNANGDLYAKKVNRKTFSLFYDKELTNSTAGNGSFGGLPVLKRVIYNYAVPLISIDKISNYDTGTIDKPCFERGDKSLSIAPYDFVCEEITMDYISNAVVFIDVTNNVINLNDTYPSDFIYYVIAKAVQLFSAEVNNKNKYQTSSAELEKEK